MSGVLPWKKLSHVSVTFATLGYALSTLSKYAWVPKRAILPWSCFLHFIRTKVFLCNYFCKDATNISTRHLQKIFCFSTSNNSLIEVCWLGAYTFVPFLYKLLRKHFHVVFKDAQKSDKVRNTFITSNKEKEPIINQ